MFVVKTYTENVDGTEYRQSAEKTYDTLDDAIKGMRKSAHAIYFRYLDQASRGTNSNVDINDLKYDLAIRITSSERQAEVTTDYRDNDGNDQNLAQPDLMAKFYAEYVNKVSILDKQ